MPRNLSWAQCARRALPSWALLVLLVVLLPVLEFSKGRRMYITDTMLEAIKFPFGPDTVPSWSVPLYSSIVPSTVISVHSAVAKVPAPVVHGGVLGALTSLLISADITNFFKLQARPTTSRVWLLHDVGRAVAEQRSICRAACRYLTGVLYLS